MRPRGTDLYDERLHKDGDPGAYEDTPAPEAPATELNDSGPRNPFEMSADSTMPCEEFQPEAGPGKRCGHDNGTCPFNGNAARCGERD